MKFPSLKSLPPEVQNDIKKRKVKHEKLLATISNRYENETIGFFGPDSITWKIYREPLVLLGSSRALLLQIAHPAIADGVKNYSDFQNNMARRAHRTFTSMVQIWFGDKNTAINCAKRLQDIHSRIRGTAAWEIEDETIYRPYCAADPDLLFWVLATMIDTSIIVTEKIKGKIPKEEKNQFFEESKITAQLMGIPLEEYPNDLGAFYERYNAILESETLCVDQSGKAISKAIFKIPYPFRKFLQLLAGGLLPPKVSTQFDLRLTKFSKKVFDLIIAISKINYRLTPTFLRHAPAFHQANYRISKAKGAKVSLIERIHHWLGENIDFYFVSNKLNVQKR